MKTQSSASLIAALASIFCMMAPYPVYGNGPVQMQVTHFDPKETFTYIFPDDFSVKMKGRAVIRYTVDSSVTNVVIEQTPDLKNWIAQEPLSVEVVATDGNTTTYEATFQILGHPDSGSDKLQYFRVNY